METGKMVELRDPEIRRHRIQRSKPAASSGPPEGYAGKRLMDVILSSVLIVLLLSWMTPLLFVIIRLDSRGPLFFRQRRSGREGLIFHCLKFRTMIPNKNSDLRQAEHEDERITRVGLILRRLHIDELPQLINILRGDMSFVGPRPHMLSDEVLFGSQVAAYPVRQYVRPGLTGLAQVKGYHGPTPDYHSIYFRTKLDRFYVYHQSMLLDLRILLQTLVKPFEGR